MTNIRKPEQADEVRELGGTIYHDDILASYRTFRVGDSTHLERLEVWLEAHGERAVLDLPATTGAAARALVDEAVHAFLACVKQRRGPEPFRIGRPPQK